MPKLSPALILDTKRCCGDGENRMQNRPIWGGWSLASQGRKLGGPVKLIQSKATSPGGSQGNFLTSEMGVGYPESLSNILKISQMCWSAGTQQTYPEHLLCVRHIKSHIVCWQVPIMSCLSSNPGYKLEGNTRGWIGWHFKGSGSGRARGVPRLGIGIGERSEGE